MAVETNFGTFTAERLAPSYDVETKRVGAMMSLHFTPKVAQVKTIAGANGQDWTIHLIQIVSEIPDPNALPGAPAHGNVGFAARVAGNGWAVDMDWQAGWDKGYEKIAKARAAALAANATAPFQWQLRVDTFKAQRANKLAGNVLTSLDPRYAQQRVHTSIPLYTAQTGEETNGNALILTSADGYKITGQPKKAAVLRDNPGTPLDTAILGMGFQVAALLEFAGQHQYLGSVSWGYHRASGSSTSATDPLTRVTQVGVSADYTTAVTHWNALTVADPAGYAPNNPMQVIQIPVN